MGWKTSEVTTLAKLAQLEYTTNVDQIAAGVDALGLGFAAQVGSDECQALVAFADKALTKNTWIVSFRGTQVTQNTSLPEIGDDLDVHDMTSALRAGQMQAGFAGPLLALWPQIKAVLPIGRRLTFTGHSLGGVRAQLAAGLFGGDAVSFGAPKGADDFFWKEGAEAGATWLRVVHEEDFAPGWSPFLPWTTQPPGDIAWLHNSRLYRVAQRTTWINESVADHSVDKYVSAWSALDQTATLS